jgi:hypothetical protein
VSYAEHTSVPVERTRAEIETLVAKHGATHSASAWGDGKAQMQFMIRGRLLRFVLLMPTDEEARKKVPRRYDWKDPTEANVVKWMEQEARRRWRCLLLAIKAKLEIVENGIETFDQAFLANIVVDGRTVYEHIVSTEGKMRLLVPVTKD